MFIVATCNPFTPLIQTKRFRGKINIQKPKPPFFEKAKYLALTKPWYPSIKKSKTPLELCTKGQPPKHARNEEKNIYQEIVAQEVKFRFFNSKLVVFCHLNPMLGDQKFAAKLQLHRANMYIEQLGRETVRLAVQGTPYEPVLSLYVSENMTIFSPELEIKKLLNIVKKFPELVVLGRCFLWVKVTFDYNNLTISAGICCNKLVSKDELVHYSTIPNLQTAQASLVQTLNSVGSQLVTNLNSHQTSFVSHLEQRLKQLEDEEK